MSQCHLYSLIMTPISVIPSMLLIDSVITSLISAKIYHKKYLAPIPGPTSYLSVNFSNFAFDEPVSPSEVVSVVGSLRPGTAGGYDNIPSWIIKNSIDLLSESLTHIVNLSIQTGIVPDLMKLARVIPIYKSGVDNLFSNYRPISILPVFSKILEKIVYNRLMFYLTENIKFCKIYFSDRQQFVVFNGFRSSWQKIECGAPQGLILGPLFFLIYIIDICNASTIAEFMKQTVDFSLEINNHKLRRVKETTFLAVILNENFSWKLYISHIASKISKSIGIIVLLCVHYILL